MSLLNSILSTVNTEIAKQENKEILDSLYVTYVYPYEYKIYLVVVFIFILLLLSCTLQGFIIYNTLYKNFF